MNIIEFANLIKKHRLSIEEVDYPCDSDTWKAIFTESLFRNNSVLLNELYIKCPSEYKEEIEKHIEDVVFSRLIRIKNEFSQTILKWVFNNLEINLNAALHPVFIAEHARGDILEFIMKTNSKNKFDGRLYEISKWLAKEEQVELFKKIASKYDLNTLNHSSPGYKDITSPNFNPFIELFESTRDKEVLKYVLKNIPEDMDFFLTIINTCAKTYEHIGENIENNSLFDITLSFMKEHRLILFNELKNKIIDKDHQVVFKNLNRLSVYNVKTLECHGIFTSYLLYRAVETVGYTQHASILAPSLEFLYENFNEKVIDEAFDQKHKMELFANLMIRGDATEAEFIFNKAPYILNAEIKDYITTALLRKGGEFGVEWAKKHMTYDEIDTMSQKSFYQRTLEQLTLWKCENFLYNENKNNENRVEKKKIKI
jgi:hypothetical protein